MLADGVLLGPAGCHVKVDGLAEAVMLSLVEGSSREILAYSLSERFRDSLSLEPTTLGTPPGIVINEEDSQRTRTHLGSAIRDVTERLREQQRFRDLKIAEGIFTQELKTKFLRRK